MARRRKLIYADPDHLGELTAEQREALSKVEIHWEEPEEGADRLSLEALCEYADSLS